MIEEVYDDRHRVIGWVCSSCGMSSAYLTTLKHIQDCEEIKQPALSAAKDGAG